MFIDRKKLKILLSVFAVISIFSSLSNGDPSLAEIEDMLSVFPRAELVTSEKMTSPNYQLALGRVEKSRGVWMPEKERRVSGELTKMTLQIPSGYSALEAFTFYRKRFESQDARTIYYCENRDCGSSNSWANNIFGIKQLYGLDNDQYYGVFEVSDVDGYLHYFVLYSVARGNKRIFTQIEWLKTQLKTEAGIAPNAEVIVDQLNSQQYFIVNGLNISESNSPVEPNIEIRDEYFSALVAVFTKDRRLQVRIVGHDYSENDLAQQTQRSTFIAEKLREKLIGAGVTAERIESHGVGSLAPAKRIISGNSNEDSRGQFRIELIKIE